jgi:hypothetical protein
MNIQKFIEDKGGYFVNTFTEQKGACKRYFVVFECENGHINEKRVDTIMGTGKTGTTWCLNCQKNNIQDAHNLAKERGFKFLSDTYSNCKELYRWKCSNNHIWKAKYPNIKTGRGCPTCLRIPFEKILKLAESKGGKCLTTKEDFINTRKTKIKWQCNEGHIWITTYNSIRRGSWCGKCNDSICERTCRKILEYIYKTEFPKKRPIWLKSDDGRRLEFDGYCESLKTSFEYQGEQHYKFVPYWHKTNEKFVKYQQRDKKKSDLCKENGIHLIIIPYTIKYEDLYMYIYQKCSNIPKNTPKNIDYAVLKVKSLNKSKLSMVQDLVSKLGGELLSTNYVNNTTALQFKCKNGHLFKQTWGVLISGTFCKDCTYGKICDEMEKRIDMFCKNNSFLLLEKYTNAKKKLRWKCEKCEKILHRTWDYIRKFENKTHC